MKHTQTCTIVVCALAMAIAALTGVTSRALAQHDRGLEGGHAHAAGATRFITVDLFVDAGDDTLGAYQIEFVGGEGVTLAGVYGGAGVYSEPPAYDPEALAGGRVVLAAFSTDADRLPTGETRIASLSLMVERSGIEWRTELVAAADAGARHINATVRAAQRSSDAGATPTELQND